MLFQINYTTGGNIMKKSLLLLSSLFVLGSVPVIAQEDNKERIAEIESQIEELELELRELKGEVSEDINEPQEVAGVTVTLLDVSYTDERNQFEDEVEKVLAITYELENKSGEDLLYTMSDFKVYVDGKEMSTYPISSDMGTVNDGRKVEAKTGFAIVGNGKIEIEWEPWLNTSGEKALWEVDI